MLPMELLKVIICGLKSMALRRLRVIWVVLKNWFYLRKVRIMQLALMRSMVAVALPALKFQTALQALVRVRSMVAVALKRYT